MFTFYFRIAIQNFYSNILCKLAEGIARSCY